MSLFGERCRSIRRLGRACRVAVVAHVLGSCVCCAARPGAAVSPCGLWCGARDSRPPSIARSTASVWGSSASFTAVPRRHDARAETGGPRAGFPRARESRVGPRRAASQARSGLAPRACSAFFWWRVAYASYTRLTSSRFHARFAPAVGSAETVAFYLLKHATFSSVQRRRVGAPRASRRTSRRVPRGDVL